MENFIVEINNKEQLETQGISLLACVEAEKLYSAVDKCDSEKLKMVLDIMEWLIRDEREDELLILLKALYILMDIELPQYMSVLESKPDLLNEYLLELANDWADQLNN